MNAPALLQRLMIKLQGYDLKVKYIPGKELFIADKLPRSKAKLDPKMTELDDDLAMHVNLVTYNLAIYRS